MLLVSGSGVIIQNDKSPVGTAGTIDVAGNLEASNVVVGVSTITLKDGINVSGINTFSDELHVYDWLYVGASPSTSARMRIGNNQNLETQFAFRDSRWYWKWS